LEKTGRSSLSYIGYSQGTTQIFAALSTNEELNHKIDVVLAMAPALKPKPIKSEVINQLVKNFEPKVLYAILGRGSFIPFVHTVKAYTPSPIFAKLIEGALQTLLGWECSKFGPQNRRESLFAHLFSDCSMSNLVHWFQIMLHSQDFCKYDAHKHTFRPSLPTEFTPRTWALKYPTKLIKTKLFLFCGENDTISDVDFLKTHLPNDASFHIIEDYGHMDFLWAECANEKCWKKLIDVLKEEISI
jgi:lysosomal acid lipase/cholesteryl ester hydrolase